MTRKEAIKALEARLTSDDVIYVADISYPQALAFAINELKAQEPKKAKKVILQLLGSDALIGYECGNCGKHINPNDKYCHECGQAVKWE